MTALDRPRLILVDGGGTGCRGRLCEISGNILSEARGGPANVATDFDQTLANLKDLISRLYQGVGKDPASSGDDIAWIGLAGAGRKDLAQRMEKALGLPNARVGTDRDIIVEAALGSGDGVAAVLGTGSFFFARDGDEERNVGGWGLRLGDECSGAWLGRELLRTTLRAMDGIAQSSGLTDEISAQFSGNQHGIVQFAETARPSDFGEFAPRLIAAADNQDPVAQLILQEGLRDLCQTLNALGVISLGRLYLLGGLGEVYRGLLPSKYSKLLTAPNGTALDGAYSFALREFAITSE